MIDSRFYQALGPLTVRALAPSAEIGGDGDHVVTSVAAADRAGSTDMCYLEAKRGAAPLANTPGVVIVSPAQAHLAPSALSLILDQRPRALFARLAHRIVAPRRWGVDAIDATARLESGVKLGAGVVIGAGATIGADTEIGPNAVIGPGVSIGRRCTIGARASIGFALIGDEVQILAGAVIGEQGFGVAGDASGPVDVPHFGRVIIQDRVTVGANSCIDRGVFDDTVIGEAAKIDNLCHVAHNCVVGRGVLMAAYGGVSGSTVIGDGVTMGGKVGIGDHRTIGPGATLAGGAVVLQDVPPKETWSGYPAKPLRKWLRESAWLSRKAQGARNESE
jgi:UDP-3-O-[3-hydroxymyristoyl] glucosamine N-acyltransferase